MTKRFDQWSRWAGPFEDIVEAGRVAVASVEKQRPGKPSPVALEVTYPRIIRTYASIEELDDGTDIRDLALIANIRLRVGEEADLSVSIHAETKKGPALSLEVVGNDEDEVNAVFDAVLTPLNRGRRLLNQTGVGVLAALVGAAFLLVVLGLLDYRGIIELERNRANRPYQLSIGAGVMVVAFGLAFGITWLNPPLQLLTPTGSSRLRRFRGLVAAVSLVLLGVAAQEIWNLVTRGRTLVRKS